MAAGVVAAGMVVAGAPGLTLTAQAASTGVHDVMVSTSTVTVFPDKPWQSVAPTMRFVLDLPSPTARISSVLVSGWNHLGGKAWALTEFRPDCSLVTGKGDVAATCTKVGAQVTIAFKIKANPSNTTFLSSPGQYNWSVEAAGNWAGGPLTYGGRYEAAAGPTVTFKRATKIVRFDASPEPVARGAKVRVTGTVKVARVCTDIYPPFSCGRGAPIWGKAIARAVNVYFDATGPAAPRLVATTTTNKSGVFTVRRTQTVTGRWYAVVASTDVVAGSTSVRDRVAVRS